MKFVKDFLPSQNLLNFHLSPSMVLIYYYAAYSCVTIICNFLVNWLQEWKDSKIERNNIKWKYKIKFKKLKLREEDKNGIVCHNN